MKNKVIIFTCLAFVLFLCFSLGVEAEEISEYKNFADSIPDDIADKLPDSVIDGDSENIADGVSEMSGVRFLLSELSDGLLSGVKSSLPLVCGVCGLLLIASLITMVSQSFSENSGASVRLISKLCVFASVASGIMGSLDSLKEYFQGLCALAAAYIPLSAALYSMGGNVSAAVASSSSFGVTLTVCEFIFAYTVFPVFCFCMCINICSVFEPSRALCRISESVKKNYTLLLSLLMAILTVSISAQTFIAAKADNLAMRGAKFILGNFIPIFGGAVSSTLGNVASSVELMRGCVGIGGIIIIILMLLPMVAELFVMRMLYSVSSVFAGIIGCEEEGGLLSEISSLYGYLLGVAAICSSAFIISFGLLAGCASAVG